MPACVMGMGVRDWGVVMGVLRGFLGVQRWLGGAGEEREMVKTGEVSRTPVGGLPSWSLSDRLSRSR